MPAISTASLRTIGGVSALLALLVLGVVGCAGGGGEYGGGEQGGSKEEDAPPVTGSFVGVAPDATPEGEAFVALVASGTEDEGQAQRQVRAYLCDGQSINEWFNEGSVEGNELNLTSEGGARLEGSLATEAATGTITLNDGESFTFTADLAAGAAGLYDVNISEDGDLRGTSEAGGRLEGMLAHQLGEDGLYPLAATLTAPDGQSVDLVAVSDEHEGGEYRWIVLEDGEVKGARKNVATGASSGYIDPTTL
jgi:hypothetical protein